LFGIDVATLFRRLRQLQRAQRCAIPLGESVDGPDDMREANPVERHKNRMHRLPCHGRCGTRAFVANRQATRASEFFGNCSRNGDRAPSETRVACISLAGVTRRWPRRQGQPMPSC